MTEIEMVNNVPISQPKMSFNVVFSEGNLLPEYNSAIRSAAEDVIAISNGVGDEFYNRVESLFDTLCMCNFDMVDVVDAVEDKIENIANLGDFRMFDENLDDAIVAFNEARSKEKDWRNISVPVIECIMLETIDTFTKPIREDNISGKVWDCDTLVWEDSDAYLYVAMTKDDISFDY